VAVLHGWKLCPRCGGALAGDLSRLECPACGFVAYANPVPAACALCVDDAGRVMLTRRAWEPYAGMWDLPGGFLHEDEHPLDGLRRELAEETGLEVEPSDWLGAFMVGYGDGDDARTVLNLVWQARVVGGEEQAADDVSEVSWFTRDELPPLDEIAMADAVRAWLKR
jgi:8-oxo-dGTP diphosphatase